MISARAAKFCLAAAVLAAASPIAACGRLTSSETVIRFWAMGREAEVVADLVPEFERENPGVRVKVQQIPWSAAHQKLLTGFAGDALPDIGQLGNTWLPEFVALGALDRAPPAAVDEDDYFPGIWRTNVVDGTAYGVPWYVDTRLLFYRRDLLADAGYAASPKTWGQWTEMLAAIKARAGPGKYGVLLPPNEPEPLLALALQQGEPLLRDNDGRGNFESEGFKRALRYYLDFFKRGLAPSASGNQVSNVWDEFARGYFAFYVTGPWNIGEFKRRLPANLQASWMTAPLPGPSGPGASIAGGSSLVVFRSARNKNAAWRFVAYLSRPEVQVRFHGLTGDLPPRRSAWADESLASDVYAAAFRDQLERVEPAPQAPEWERIAAEIGLVSERLVAGRMTIDESAAELNRRADRILEKRRWMASRDAAP